VTVLELVESSYFSLSGKKEKFELPPISGKETTSKKRKKTT
jgi:hypothetical protein